MYDANTPLRNIYAKDRISIIGFVSQRATSIGASKIAQAPVQASFVNGQLSWVVCQER